MAVYGRPGVYVTERLLPAPIAVVGTAESAGACLGKFAKGPTTVTRVTSWYDFVQTFGGYNASYPATFGVGMFFQNGGGELFVRRVVAGDAVAASASILPADEEESAAGTVTAKSEGADGNRLRAQFTETAREGYYNFIVYEEVSSDEDVIVESFSEVVLDDEDSSDYIETIVNMSSRYVKVTITAGTTAPVLSILPLINGANGTNPDAEDYSAAIEGFSSVDRPLVLFAPEVVKEPGVGAANADDIHDAMISWAQENNGFVVVDTAEAVTSAGAPNVTIDGALAYATARQSSSHAAVYYPHVFIADPVGRSPQSVRKVGPAGAIAGLYIFTDKQTGPFKAPAGIRANLRGAVALERPFTSTELDNLNLGKQSNGTIGAPVNAIRNLPGAGIISMGARTLLQDGTANRYVNMRRSLIFLNKSLRDLTQFALFENNDENLWARLRTVITVFLNEYRNQGGLRGATASDAFFVKVDEENNPAEKIAQGEVHIEVGVALQYPAEFVVINLSQKTAE
jgi:hypothetical protein